MKTADLETVVIKDLSDRELETIRITGTEELPPARRRLVLRGKAVLAYRLNGRVIRAAVYR